MIDEHPAQPVLEDIGVSLGRIAHAIETIAHFYVKSIHGQIGEPDEAEKRETRSLVGSFGEAPVELAAEQKSSFVVKVPHRNGRLTLNRIVLSVRPRERVPHMRLYEVRIDGLRVREPLIAPEPMKPPAKGEPAPEHQLVSASFFDAGYPDDAPVLLGGETLAVEVQLDGQAPGPAYVTVGYVVDLEIPPG